LSQCFNWAPRHEGVFGEWRYSSTHSLTSVLDGGEWSVSQPGRFTPREKAPGTHWIGGWVGSRAGLDAVVKRKIPSSRQESNPRTPIVQPVAQRYTNWAITAYGPLCITKFNWCQVFLPWEANCPGLETDQSPPFSAEVNNTWRYTSISPIRLWRRFPCLIKHHAMKTDWMIWGTAPRILNLSTRWKWVVNFMLRPL
jgi:hypothetical protein